MKKLHAIENLVGLQLLFHAIGRERCQWWKAAQLFRIPILQITEKHENKSLSVSVSYLIQLLKRERRERE